MTNNLRLGLILGLITLGLFAIVQIWLGNSVAATPAAFLQVSVSVCSFALPLLYAIFGFLAVFKFIRKQALSFREIFSKSAGTQFIGGLLSLAAIFIYFNTFGKPAEDYLQTGMVQDFKTKSEQAESGPEMEQLIEIMQSTEVNLFSINNFLLVMMVLLAYYGFISILFGIFFKNRKI